MEAGESGGIILGQLAIRFLIEGKASGGSVAMFEFDVPAGARVPIAHSHDGYEETIYGLDGILTWTLDGRRVELGPRQVLCIPRGVVHHFENCHADTARVLAIVTPGILGPDYFREVAAVLRASTGGPPNHAGIAKVMLRHGLTPAP